jgi:membrane associated rhomboid family serine protease
MTTTTYLKTKRPTGLIYLVLFFLITTILGFVYHDFFYANIILFPSDLKNINSWYKFFTYPLYTDGLVYWLYYSVIIVFAGYILRNKLTDKSQWMIILFSTLLGGLTYSLMAQNKNFDQPLAGLSFIAWGLSTCAVIQVIKKFNSSINFERIFVGLFILSIFLSDYSNLAYVTAQVSVILIGLTFGIL